MGAPGSLRNAIPAALIAFCGLTGCNDEHPSATTAPASASPALSAPAEPVPERAVVKTTSAKLAMGNLLGQIKGVKKTLESSKGNLRLTSRGNALLLQQARYLGQLSGFDEALAFAEAAVKEHPENPISYSLRAEARAALHLFEEADADLAKARELSTKPRGQKIELSIAMGRGEYEKVLEARRANRERAPNFETWADEATVLAHMGKKDEAELAFQAAEGAFGTTNPFPLAWLYFEWGSMYERLGELDKAVAKYRLAHARMPNFAHSTAHLALLVPPSEGIEMLNKLVEQSDDPEYLALLGKLQNTVKPDSGKDSIEKAAKRFDELMTKYPAAFADHAARFWLDAGSDLAKAEDAAKKNFQVRKSPASYTLMLEVLKEKKDDKSLCELSADAKKLPYPSSELTDVLKSIEATCKS